MAVVPSHDGQCTTVARGADCTGVFLTFPSGLCNNAEQLAFESSTFGTSNDANLLAQERESVAHNMYLAYAR